MRLYPDIPVRRANAVTRDAATIVALIVLALLGVRVYHTLDSLEVLGRGVHDAGAAVQNGFASAGNAVDGIPLVGGDLAKGLKDAGNATGGPVAEAGTRGERRVHRLALLLGTLTFLLPAATLLSRWLPQRLQQIRTLTTADRVLSTGGDPERRRLVAMRAAFSLPYGTLLAHTRDPIGDLAEGRYEALVDAIAEEAGLRVYR
jgi:hypothetical protein